MNLGEYPLIFLGAGASAEFAIPVIRTMTKKFIQTHPQHQPRITKILCCLRRVGFPTNIENILSFARGQANPKKALLDSSPFAACFVYDSNIPKLGYDRSAKTLVQDIEEFIAQKFLVLQSV